MYFFFWFRWKSGDFRVARILQESQYFHIFFLIFSLNKFLKIILSKLISITKYGNVAIKILRTGFPDFYFFVVLFFNIFLFIRFLRTIYNMSLERLNKGQFFHIFCEYSKESINIIYDYLRFKQNFTNFLCTR